jgi:excisionase family DNA binding protein
MQMTNENRKSLTTGQAAKLIGRNSRTVRRWVDLGKVEGYKTPSNLRYVYQDALDALMNGTKS